MSIIDEDAVLVLGAGCSAPFFFPLGADLIDALRKQIYNERTLFQSTEIMRPGPWNRYYESLSATLSGFNKSPIRGAVASQWKLADGHGFQGRELNEDLELLSKIEDLLEDQTSETIDDFIVENPAAARLVKIGIATQLFMCSYHYDNNQEKFSPLQFQRRSVWNSKERNWVHLLINIVRQGIRSKIVSGQNKVKIVTFNYDGVLERILDAQFSNTEAGYDDWRSFVDIMHVHGYCGNIDDHVTDPAKTCVEWASNISVVNEQDTPQALQGVRQNARSAIRNARKIYAAGFAFSRPNLELLALNTLNPSGLKISFCNWDGNAGLRNAVGRLANDLEARRPGGARREQVLVKMEEASGKRGEELSVSDWFKAGYAGDLPG